MSTTKKFDTEKAYRCEKQGYDTRYFTLKQLESMGTDPGGETHDGWAIVDAPEVPEEAKGFQGFAGINDSGIKYDGFSESELINQLIDREKQISDLKAENEARGFGVFTKVEADGSYIDYLQKEHDAAKERITALELENEQLKADLETAKEMAVKSVVDTQSEVQDLGVKGNDDSSITGTKKATKIKKDSHAVDQTENSRVGDNSDPERTPVESTLDGSTGDTEGA